ncbi:MAG TPA: phosphodiester glycosidase family protein, partial [Steroidobacteraceae bacterium]|nr:phosphodiester glycosidase family protein [Steroidobacteraceae bacterium]
MSELNVAAHSPHLVGLFPISMTLAPGSLFAAECAPFGYQNISATVCRIDTREERLRLFHTDEKGRPLKYFSGVNRLLKASNERLAFAMNAGMYHSDFSAVGLLVMDGKQVQPLNLETADGNFFLKPNGVFLVSDRGASVIESSRYPSLNENVSIATQSGPMLLLDGAL